MAGDSKSSSSELVSRVEIILHKLLDSATAVSFEFPRYSFIRTSVKYENYPFPDRNGSGIKID